jgi:hypothetical protein
MGRPFGNENNWSGGYYREKCDFISSFMCNMCFENTIAMGYLTEKPLHARAMGALPLLYCDTNIPDFNWEATVNLNDFSSVREFVELTEFYLSKPDLLFEKLDSPIFHQIPCLDYVANFISSSYQKKYLQ